MNAFHQKNGFLFFQYWETSIRRLDFQASAVKIISKINRIKKTRHFSGMSSRIGNVLGGRTTYIGGAPRSQENGQVLMFEPALRTEDDTLHITPDHYLTGDQFGACFGYDIALVDLNGDGWVAV